MCPWQSVCASNRWHHCLPNEQFDETDSSYGTRSSIEASSDSWPYKCRQWQTYQSFCTLDFEHFPTPQTIMVAGLHHELSVIWSTFILQLQTMKITITGFSFGVEMYKLQRLKWIFSLFISDHKPSQIHVQLLNLEWLTYCVQIAQSH